MVGVVVVVVVCCLRGLRVHDACWRVGEMLMHDVRLRHSSCSWGFTFFNYCQTVHSHMAPGLARLRGNLQLTAVIHRGQARWAREERAITDQFW